MRQFIQIDKRYVHFFSYPAGRIQILSMRIHKHISFHLITSFRLRHPFGREISPYNGIKQYRISSLFAGFSYETTQVIIEGSSRIGMQFFGSFLIIVSELNKHIISLFQFGKHRIPTPFIDETQ